MASTAFTTPTPRAPFLLQGDLHQYERRATSVDYQERFRSEIRSTPKSVAEPAILIITRAADHDVDRLSLELGRAGVPLYRLDTDRCTYLNLAIDVDRRELHLNSHRVIPRVVWLRHLDCSSLGGPRTLIPYVQQQYPTVLKYLTRFPGSQQINPADTYGCLDRLEQLSTAAAAGMQTPRTCVASCIDDACQILGLPPQRLIAKPPHDHFIESPPGYVTGVFPRPVAGADITSVEPVPLVYQELIEVDAEWRLYWVDGQVIAYHLNRNNAASLWTDPDSINVASQGIPPAGLEASIADFCVRTNLRYGAFDFLEADGVTFFLEVNLDGDWAWFERKAGDDRVSQAARNMLINTLEVNT